MLDGADAHRYLTMVRTEGACKAKIKELEKIIEELKEENKACLAEVFKVQPADITPFDELVAPVVEEDEPIISGGTASLVDKVKEAKEIVAELANDAPKQQYEIKGGLGNPFEESEQEVKTVKETTITETTYSPKRYKWRDVDERAIKACMSKPKGHSHRNLDYIKGRLPLEVTWRTLKNKLQRMGISTKGGKAEWK